MNKISILIPTIVGREVSLKNILNDLERQCGGVYSSNTYRAKHDEIIFTLWYNNRVECIIFQDEKRVSIGEKRNKLLEFSQGEYVCFLDDDDLITKNYIELILHGISSGVDCCSLKGIITTNGGSPEYFEHSLKYNEYKTNVNAKFALNEIKYERFPNHLSTIKAEIAKQFKFPEMNWGEDTDWATQIHKSGLLKTEYYISEVLYYYNYISNK